MRFPPFFVKGDLTFISPEHYDDSFLYCLSRVVLVKNEQVAGRPLL